MSAHGYTRYTHGCRCEVCRKAKAEYVRARRTAARRAAKAHPHVPGRNFVPGITHGLYGYGERGCRCDICLASRAAALRQRYLRRKAAMATLDADQLRQEPRNPEGETDG